VFSYAAQDCGNRFKKQFTLQEEKVAEIFFTDLPNENIHPAKKNSYQCEKYFVSRLIKFLRNNRG
jgi:hypothetical protein